MLDSAPAELQVAIREFWPPAEWDNAARVAEMESGFNPFALANTTDAEHSCGDFLQHVNGVAIYAELSVGYFQINACNFPDWEWQRFYNARHNAGTAHLLWQQAGGTWKPWYLTSVRLGLTH